MSIKRCLLSVCATAAAALGFAESQLIARLDAGMDPQQIALNAGVLYRDKADNSPFVLFGVPAGTPIATAQATLQATPGVLWAEDNVDLGDPEDEGGGKSGKGSSLSVIGDRDDLLSKNTQVMSQINWSATLANSPGRAVRVAVLDTGLSRRQGHLWAKVDASYDATLTIARPPAPPILDGMVVRGGPINGPSKRGFPSTRLLLCDDVPMHIDSDGNGIFDQAVGHGTMVAGIIDQVDPQVRLVIVKVADSDGHATAWRIIKGLAFAVNNGAEVANISLGSVAPIAALTDVLDWAEGSFLLPVIAIGNDNAPNALYPARLHKGLCVAGLAPDNSKATFSNWDGGCDSSAPAVGISSQWWDGTEGVWSGTSFAAPFVSAAIADCLRRGPHTLSRILIDDVNKSGVKIDSLNSDYRGKLGTLLNHAQLNAQLIGP